jgi:hypothetical protein
MKLLTLILFVMACIACSPSTVVTGTWKDPQVTQAPTKYKTIFIAPLTTNMTVKASLEDAIADEVTKRGIKALKSSDYFTPGFSKENSPSKEVMMKKIAQTGADAIMTVALIDKEQETRYVPGTRGYAPMGLYPWYGSFYGYYNYWYPTFYDPGYYTTDKIYYIETNLYDVKKDKLVWSAQSKTTNPASLDAFNKDFIKAIGSQMEKDGLLAKGSSISPASNEVYVRTMLQSPYQ